MNQIFDLCVNFLYWLADLVGMTYKEINIWIFVILEPIAFVVLGWIIFHQRKVLKKLKGKDS